MVPFFERSVLAPLHSLCLALALGCGYFGYQIPMTLYDALKRFKEKYPKERLTEIETLQDKRGKYAFVVRSGRDLSKHCILSTKNSMNGGEVSVHEKLFLKAKEKNWPLILCIDDRFYKFLPGDIEREGHPNERYGETMVNFHIRIGRNLEKPEESKHEKIDLLKRELELEFVR